MGFESPRGVPEASWRGLGASWEALGGVLGPLQGPAWEILVPLGGAVRRLGAVLARLGRSLNEPWGCHGRILESPGGPLGALPGLRGGEDGLGGLTLVPGTQRKANLRPAYTHTRSSVC